MPTKTVRHWTRRKLQSQPLFTCTYVNPTCTYNPQSMNSFPLTKPFFHPSNSSSSNNAHFPPVSLSMNQLTTYRQHRTMASSKAKLLLRIILALIFPIFIFNCPFHEFLLLFLNGIFLACLAFCTGIVGSDKMVDFLLALVKTIDHWMKLGMVCVTNPVSPLLV